MAFTELETKRCERLLRSFIEKRRPPAHIRNKLDFGFRVEGQRVEIFEIRPVWRNSKKKMESSIAKATHVKRQDDWKIYWQRANLKWYRYDPTPEVKRLEDFLTIVDQDRHGCFFG